MSRIRRSVGACSSPHRGRRVALLPALVVAALGCGVPSGGDTFERIEDDDVLFDLAEPSTTTLPPTTTTIPPTTPPPLIPVTTPPPPPTTALPSVDVTVYFVTRDSLVPVETAIVPPLTSGDLLTLLEDGPGDTSPTRDSFVEPGLVSSIDVAGGIVRIDMDRSVFFRIDSDDRRIAIAQLALTFIDAGFRAGLALFTFDGEPARVPVRNNFSTTEPVSFEDFADLLVDNPVPVGTTTTTTTTTTLPTTTSSTEPSETTTAPPDSSPDDDSAPSTAARPTTTG